MKKKGIYLVGAAKSGTTSLANNLGNHPDIDFNCAKKEPHYHIRKIFKQLSKNCEMVKKTNAVTALDDYQKTFSGKCQFFLDASTMYLPYSKEAIDSAAGFNSRTALYCPFCDSIFATNSPTSSNALISLLPRDRLISRRE